MASLQVSTERIPTAEPPSPSGRASRRAVWAWMGFVLLVLYAILIGGGWPGIYLVWLRVFSLAVVALALAAWFVVALRRPAWRPATAIWPTLAVPVLALAVATLASRLPRLGLEYVAWGVLLAALYLLLVRILATSFARERIGALGAMLALVIGAVYIVSVVGRWLEWWGLVGSVAVPPLRPLFASLTFGNPSAVLTVEVLLTAVAFAGLGLESRGRRLLLALIALITTAVIIISGSRAGWLAVAGAALIVGGVWILRALRDGSLGRIAARRDARLALGGVVIAGFIGAIVMAPAVLLRVSSSGDGGRAQYFTTALRMFAEAPVLGTGPGTWAVQRAAYTEPGELDWYIPHAHDVYLQTLAELGLVGLLAGLIALAPVGWLVLRGIRGQTATSPRWAWAAFFALVYLGLHQLLDFYLNMPAVMLLAAIPVAILDATSDQGIGIRNLRGRAADRAGQLARAAFWVGCLAAVLVLARTESVAWTHEAAVNAVYAADWETARGPADEAAASDPDMTPYQVTRGLVASAQHDWAVAAEALTSSAETDDMPMSWLGLAQAQIGLAVPAEDVVDSIERALRLGYQQPSVVYAAGYLYDRLGMTELADEAYADVIAAYPSLAGDPSWTDDEDLRDRFADILDTAMGRDPARAWEMALMVGDADRAHALNTAEAGARGNDLLIDAWQGDRRAIDEVSALADASPPDASVLSWATRIAARYGDTERADRYQRLAVFVVTEGGELPGTEIRVDRDGWLGAVPAGSRMGFAGHYLYRRPLTIDLLPPGLPRLVHSEREP